MTTVAPTEADLAAKAAKDPLASHLIPEMFDDRRYEAEGRIMSYRKGKLLGKGGFAKVFSGTLLPGKAQYAIKVVAKASLQKVRAQQKLQTEIKIHKAMRHVNVVKFERVFDDRDFYFIVMELCDYNSMSELMKRRKKISEPEARFYLAQIVEALQYLHGNLVIHRDLKLGNLFIDSNMHIKVGDFGLATHLSSADERRKTVCGTPNYIAPEILEGKHGHSFEVDIWSTGVILYTLLVGKPPFESKDVKSTYKRILANSYAFPEHTPVSSDSRNLIRQMLQPRAENRPSLSKIAVHPFFARPSAYMPTTLPESALHECPRLVQMNDFVHASSTYGGVKDEVLNENYFSAHVKGAPEEVRNKAGNENDPNAMNRVQAGAEAERMMVRKESGDAPRTRSASVGLKSTAPSSMLGAPANSSNSNNAVSSSTYAESNPSVYGTATAKSSSATALQMMASARTSTRSQATTAVAGSAAAPTAYATRGSTSAATVTSSVSSTTSTGSDKTKQNPYAASSASASTRPSSRGHFNAQGPAGYTQKFDIYVDSKAPQVAPAPSSSAPQAQSQVQSQVGRKREAPAPIVTTCPQEEADRRLSARTKAFSVEAVPSTQPAVLQNGSRKPQYEFEIDKMRTDFEQVQLAEPRARSNKAAVSTPPAASAAPVEAWSWQDNRDVFPPSQAVLPAQHVCTPTPHNAPQMTYEPAPASESEPMCISTPQDQVINPNACKALGTLETMHDMLNNSFSVVDNNAAMAANRNRWSQEAPETVTPSAALVAKVWVVRYVDYTSKYGLGFLFNTGSAGVYFNDSTKIVLSADGTVFQYTERRRRDSSTGSEHSSQKHLISSYPPELQKKVTLLKHFRNYLVDQQKNSTRSSAETDDGTQGNPGLIKDGVISEGACTSVKFGESSTRYNSVEENNRQSCGAPDSPLGMQLDEEDDLDMPFLKKWVRTKHAILFRISNRTVQVVFYDRSEVLLSSEARVITYVSKQGLRSEHSLDDVLQTGRLDIAKRLKYTKDIMYRLINTQSK